MSSDLDTSLEEVVDALRRYVAVARGVRAEFDPEQADLDPRVEEATVALGLALGRFEDDIDSEVGFVPTLQPMWERDDTDDDLSADEDDTDGAALLTADEFSVGLVVGVESPAPPEALDRVLGIVDDAASALVDKLEREGYVVTEYFVARGEDEIGDDIDGAGNGMDEG
ncbi:MAG: hypothetical protein ACLGIA_05540 [Actinomycetes bacterium]